MKTQDSKKLLLNLYLINIGANVIGSIIVGALNLLTPAEVFKLWRAYLLHEGWFLAVIIYPFIIIVGSTLQYIAQRPLKSYFDAQRSETAENSVMIG